MKSSSIKVVILLIVALTGMSFLFVSKTGMAGYTGSPGEGNCGSCHSGGSSSASSISISAIPSFTNNEYVPGTTYTITITVNASGFSQFGFGCEILNASNANAGLMQNQGAGVKFLNSGARKNAVQSTAKSGSGSANFQFEWVAPASGAATFYVSGNAVNGNNNSAGDFPVTPITLALQAGAPVDPVGLAEGSILSGEALLYPNPANSLAGLSFMLKQEAAIEAEILSLDGKSLKRINLGQLQAGLHNQSLDVQDFAPGLYFVKLSAENKKLSQKLLILE